MRERVFQLGRLDPYGCGDEGCTIPQEWSESATGAFPWYVGYRYALPEFVPFVGYIHRVVYLELGAPIDSPGRLGPPAG
jgi:hypothetical protein